MIYFKFNFYKFFLKKKDSVQNIFKEENDSNYNFLEKCAEDKSCRICLRDSIDNEIEENPLISPCNCIGSMKHIHYFCLKKWIMSKINMNSNDAVISILWEYFKCELCKSKLSLEYELNNGKFLKLFDLLKTRDKCQDCLIDYISNFTIDFYNKIFIIYNIIKFFFYSL